MLWDTDFLALKVRDFLALKVRDFLALKVRHIYVKCVALSGLRF